MTTQQIADRLVELCRKADFEAAQKELFADDASSHEPEASEVFEKDTYGLQAIIEKGHKFEDITQEIHKLEVSEPIVATHSFALIMRMDMTMKGKDRMDMSELCVYNVKDGKIISETFHV